MLKYFLFKIIHSLVLLLPKKYSYWIGCRSADLDYLFKRKLRRAVKSNLKFVLSSSNNGNIPKSVISANAKGVFRNFAKYLVDFFSFTRLDKDNIYEFIKVEGLENMKMPFKKGKGAIGLTAHLGNWELCGAVISLLGFNVNAVVLSHENTKINRLFVNQRAAKGINVIPVGSSFRKYLNVLRKNQLIGLVGDRLTSDNGIEVNFFGRPVVVPKGPALLSLRTGAPIVPSFMIRNPDDTFKLIFEEPIDPGDFSGNHETAIKSITCRIVSTLEKHIRQYPSQWFLFYKVWN